MESIKGTLTEQNLLKAFAGESQARNRYTYFASVAKKEGYEQIAAVFTETAEQEKEHAPRDASARRPKTCWPRRRANTKSGMCSIRDSPRPPSRRVSPR